MRNLLIFLLLLITNLGFGQSVSAPDSKSFLPSTTGQDASGFSLSGFSSTATLLASISLVNPPTGTTFYLTTTTGLTAASGFTLAGNKTRLVVTGTMTNINTALASLKVNTGSVRGNVLLSVAATVNPVGYYYNGVNGHFYRPISTGTTYTNARAAALTTTFKGQQGYLVTITSADEDAFIQANVPQTNIWFALTDEVSEARWTIDAGPEAGTLIKINNGQLNGNIPGQYNNWAPGEPNNSGNEDYAVTKWSGGSQWNDLPNHFSCPYVIEYGTWTNPDNATFTEFYTNSVTHTNGDVLTARFNIDFGSNVDETKFSAKANTFVNNLWGTTTNTSRALSGLGKVDITNDLDTTKVSDGKRATISAGQVEYSYVNISNGITTLYIDLRVFDSTQPSDVKLVSILDVYSNGVFNETDTYKLLQHLIGVQSINEYSTLTYLMKLYGKSEYDAITKSNWNTQFNYTRSLYPFNLNSGTLNNTYNVSVTWKGDVNLSHSAQQTPPAIAGSSIKSMSIKPMSITISNQINASIITEIVGDSVNAYITIDPLQQELVGTQFKLNYDNSLLKFSSVSYKTKGSPTNYGTDKGDYINFGSLITDGGILDNTTEYKISFKPQTKLNNVLGLISIAFTDAVNKSGNTLKVKIK